jgi:hypothetical protein
MIIFRAQPQDSRKVLIQKTSIKERFSITVLFPACPHGAALPISKTTVAMAMLSFELFDQHHGRWPSGARSKHHRYIRKPYPSSSKNRKVVTSLADPLKTTRI